MLKSWGFTGYFMLLKCKATLPIIFPNYLQLLHCPDFCRAKYGYCEIWFLNVTLPYIGTAAFVFSVCFVFSVFLWDWDDKGYSFCFISNLDILLLHPSYFTPFSLYSSNFIWPFYFFCISDRWDIPLQREASIHL